MGIKCVNCRVGSLEIIRLVTIIEFKVNCRVGSLETTSKM